MWLAAQWLQTTVVWLWCASVFAILWWLMHGGPTILARGVWRLVLQVAFRSAGKSDNLALSQKRRL